MPSDTNAFTSFLQKFLLSFGVIALFVGSFVIANSLSITVTQRTREFATLRTLGASKKQIRRSVLLESFIMGFLASLVGLFLGLALAKFLFWLFGEVGFTLPNTGLLFKTRTIVVCLIVGTGVTMLASLRPARRATRVPPIAAVREGAVLPPGRFAKYRGVGSATLAVVGFLALAYGMWGAYGTGPVLLFMGIGAVLRLLRRRALHLAADPAAGVGARRPGRPPRRRAQACSPARTRCGTRSGRAPRRPR